MVWNIVLFFLTLITTILAGALQEPDEIPGVDSDAFDRAKPLEECLDSYWQKGGELDLLEVNPSSPEVENAVLKRLGNAPFSIGNVNLATLLSKAYVIAGRAALQKASGEAENEGQQ